MTESEEESKPSVADWVHLSAGVDETSLWDSLHDSVLQRVDLDRLDRTLLLEFDVGHIREFHRLADTSRFRLQFSGVKSLRVSESVWWPGEFSIPEGTQRERASEMMREIGEKSIEQSLSWQEFAEKLAAENGTTEVFEATLAEGAGSLALRLFLHVNDDFYPELFVRAESMAITLSTGKDLTIEEFMHMGEAYWEDFAERGRKHREAAGANGEIA